jgi:hypothetical protein
MSSTSNDDSGPLRLHSNQGDRFIGVSKSVAIILEIMMTIRDTIPTIINRMRSFQRRLDAFDESLD